MVDPNNKFSIEINLFISISGYQYTFNLRRLWRKTRSTRGLNCIGVDANRNYDMHWQEVGSSSNSCSETFHGPSAFSEPESQLSRDIMKGVKNCKLFLSLHSYGNYLLYPWAYTNGVPKNWKDMEDVAQAGAKAMKNATGVEYTVGSTAKTLYAASGKISFN